MVYIIPNNKSQIHTDWKDSRPLVSDLTSAKI